MTQQPKNRLLMSRPNLSNIPILPPLMPGYTLQPLHGEEALESLATTLSLAFDYPRNVNIIRAKLLEAPDVKAVYVITWNNIVVATASSRYLPERFPDAGYVHWVGTHPGHVRKGLAWALAIHLLQDFASRHYKCAVLETEDFRIAAIKTYFKLGFIPVYDVLDEDHRDRWSAICQKLFV